MLQARKVDVSILVEVIRFFSLHQLSSHSITLGSTESLTEITTSILPGGKARSARKVDNFTTICEPFV
jgi:hypothetical protein